MQRPLDLLDVFVVLLQFGGVPPELEIRPAQAPGTDDGQGPVERRRQLCIGL